MRYHHEAFVELRSDLEAPPRYPRGITPCRWDTTTLPLWNYARSMRHHHVTLVELRPVDEAPPRYPRGITHGRWGTTTLPSWNYALSMRHHHELPLGGSTGLSPLDEVPPWTPPRRVHEIMSIRWDTTMNTPYEGHGITSYPHFTHVSPTTLRVLMHINLMPICIYIYQTNQAYITPSPC